MIDLHPDFSHAHTVSKAYFSLPLDYLLPIGGARWSDSSQRLVIGTESQFADYESIAKFLEGFASHRPIVPFGQIVHLLKRLLSVRDSSETFAVIRSFTRLRFAFEVGPIWPWRNAGALMGMLCEELSGSVSAPLVEILCARLRDAAFPIQWFAGLHNGRAIDGEEPDITAESVDLILAVGLDRLTDDELAHWLKFGRGPVGDAGKTLLLEPPEPLTWDAIVSELLKRPRLSTASAYADQMVTALSVPPRRHAPQQLPQGGYADVVTRGHVERLLPSQHAFDDLEFLRRYAEGELLYFRREEPPSRNRMEMAIALDQGVRTWGDVRLVLTAAVLALVGRADRKGLRLTIAATSRPGYVEPLGMSAEDLGQLLEMSDLSRDPGMALERVLDDPAPAPRDIYLLTHPFALAEDDVRSAALRVRPGDRLFALTLTAKGAAELCELRHGLPVRLRAFHVDFAAATAPPAAKPAPLESADPGLWTGSVESRAWPIPFPIDGPVAHFDFDHAGTRLFVVYANGMIGTWELATKRMEVLPRPVHEGQILVEWIHLLGVRDGFALIGRARFRVVVMHYDLRTRICRTIPLPEGSPDCRLVPLRGNHAVVLVNGLWMLGVVHLGRGTWNPAGKNRTFSLGRTLRPFEPGSQFNNLGTYRVERGTVTLLGPESTSQPWQPFTPKTDGKPTHVGDRVIDAVQLAGTTAALASHDAAYAMKAKTIDLFRGPDGDFIRQIGFPSGSGSPRFRLSQDGRLVSFCVREQIEVQAVADPRRMLLTATGTGRHLPRMWVGTSSFIISCGRKGCSWHLVEWSGDLTVRSEVRSTNTLTRGSRTEAFARFIAAEPKEARKIETSDPSDRGGSFFLGQIHALHLSLDRHGQMMLLDANGRLVLHFYARGDSWSAWMPDGTRLGRGNIHVWRNTPGAAAKMGAALRRAMKGGGT